ncbi:ABC transporter ATP-binding protein [Cellulosimicrobium sp. PMB13]|uniref:ABC transporter ATP-binding protein n=1 Tax=Cellulosimicrobium sp. PMB13 TaxID=3120158 RepID=UPI003F4C9276
MSTAIDVVGLHKSYGDVHAVDGISLRVATGEFLGILGPNGAGKTTLIEVVEGLREPDAGTVRVLGEDPHPRNRALLPRIGVQTQSSAFFTRLTAREHLRTMAALYGLGDREADAALERVSLVEKADARVNKLSGGQRQRLAIASALVHDPELVFFDEPTAALDPQARRDLWRLLLELKGDGKTIVYTTHHLEEAETLCDRVAIVSGGRIVALGSPRDLIGEADPRVQLVVPRRRLDRDTAATLPGVIQVDVEGEDLVLTTEDAGSLLTAISAAVGLDGIRTRTASLEDVYLDLIGASNA